MVAIGNIKVVVRCRPLNAKELARGANCFIRMEGNQTLITQPASNNNEGGEDTKAFTFDRSFWSVHPKDANYASQDTVYEDVGQELLDHAFHGYHCCIFAYGQTGSGKSYTMLGYGEDQGIIPRTCADLFSRISATEAVDYQVEVSYLEIYNEKVRDLLNPRNKSNLKVREHPSLGPYVEDLSRLAVKSFDDIISLMDEGNKARTVAATNMNETSSRSHAVFTIFLTSRKVDETTKVMTEKVSRISLVDLAGSERADSTGATGTRLKEGANINRSLTTLGKVIAALAERSSAAVDTRKTKKPKEYHIPYRDSILTWLLKDCLGGNSRTVMIAAISPADYEETLSTLRYADQAKRIKNKPVINEDPNAKLIRELKEEIQALRDTLMVYAPEEVDKIASPTSPRIPLSDISASRLDKTYSPVNAKAVTAIPPPARPTLQRTPSKEISFLDASGVTQTLSMDELVDQLKASQKLLDQTNQTWEEKLDKTQQVHGERERALEAMGLIILEKGNSMGILTPKQTPHLVNLNEDPLMAECLMYQLKPGSTRVGHSTSDHADIRLSGPTITDLHCSFENNNGVVTLRPEAGSTITVNGMAVVQQTRLHNGYRIILGDCHIFRSNHPQEVRQERDRRNSSDLQFSMASDGFNNGGRSDLSFDRDGNNGGPCDIVDWNSAKREALLYHYYNTSNYVDGIIGGSRRTSLVEDELMSRTTSLSSVRLSNGSFAFSTGLATDTSISNTNPGYRHSGSNLSIDTGLSFASEDLYVPTDVMDNLTTKDDFDSSSISSSTLGKWDSYQHQLWLKKSAYEEQIRLANLHHDQPTHIQAMEAKLHRVVDDMQRLMENQRKVYESRIKRLSSQLPPGAVLSPTELILASKAITQWRKHRYVLMAETMLVHAIVIKEANIMAKDLGKDVSYQYIVVHDNAMVTSRSFWEATATDGDPLDLQDDGCGSSSDDVDLLQAVKPCIAVQVVDKKHGIVSIWSVQEIKRRLEQMQPIYNFTGGRPLSRSQIAWKDPFYPVPHTRFTLIGLASISLRHLVHQAPMETVVDVFDRNVGRVMGRLRLTITPLGRPATSSTRQHRRSISFLASSLDSSCSSASSSPFGDSVRSFGWNHYYHQSSSSPSSASTATTAQNSNDGSSLSRIGQQQMIQVQLSALLDLDESLFTQVHAQFRLSSFGNVPGDQDKVFATEPISGFGAGPIPFNYTQNLTTVITNNTTMAQDLTVELYGRAQMEHLNNIVARHIERGKEDTSSAEYNNNNSSSKQKGTISAASLPTPPTSKPRPLIRSYTDDELLLLKERHHVVTYLQVCELGKDGEHSPVNVMTYSAQDQGCFYLRQGLQRQLKITMMHDSGLRLPLVKVENVAISNILIMMDEVDNSDGSNKTQTQEPAEFKVVANNDRPVVIPLHQNQPLECHPDGTCILMAQGPWDTSLHDTAHLNRVTAPQHRVRATLSWQVVCNKSTGPLVFSMDFYMKIHNRDLAPPNSKSNNSSAILSYFSSAFYQYHRMSYKLRGIFSVHLSPPLSRQASQLWKLNTANKYIRGEELLDPGFGPRGVSLIEDYREAAKRMRRRQQVLETRQTLIAIEQGQKQYQRWSLNQQQQRPSQQQINNQSSTLKPHRTDADNLDRRKDLLQRTLQLWTARFGSQKEIVITQTPQHPSVTARSPYQPPDDDHAMKYTPKIRHLAPTNIVTKKGYMRLLHHDGVNWIKRWLTLRRPFIIVYEDQTEIEELAVIDLTSVHVEHKKGNSKEPHTFTLQTTNNAYVFQVKDSNDLMDWTTKIDQFYPTDAHNP